MLTPEQIEIIDKADEFLRHKSDCAIHQDLGFEDRICGCGYVEAMLNLRSLKFAPLESASAPAPLSAVTTGDRLMSMSDFRCLNKDSQYIAYRDAVFSSESKIVKASKMGKALGIVSRGWEKEFKPIDREQMMDIAFDALDTTLSAPAPLSSEAVGKVRDALESFLAIGKRQSLNNPKYDGYFVSLGNALALLTPSPSEAEQ